MFKSRWKDKIGISPFQNKFANNNNKKNKSHFQEKKKSVQNPDARAASTGFARMSGVYVFYEFYI